MARPSMVLILILLTVPVSAQVQSDECSSDAAARLFRDVGEGVSGQGGASGETYVELLAGTASGRVFLRTGSTISGAENRTDGKTYFNTFGLEASAPIEKKKVFSEISTLDGLSSGFQLEALWSNFSVKRGSPASSDGEVTPEALCICQRAFDAALDRGVPRATLAKELKDNACSEVIGKHSPEFLDEWEEQFWESKRTWYFGASASVGHEEFEYFDAETFKKQEIDQQPWAVKGSIGGLPSSREFFLLFSLEYQEFFKAADTVTRCPLMGDDFLACETGAFEKPGKKEKHLVSALARWKFWKNKKGVERIGVSPQITYDQESEVLAADLPIYFARDSKNNLVGGVRLGWNDDVDDVKVGVFVSSKVFGLF